MKNTNVFKILWMIIFIVIIGFTMTGCDLGDNNNGNNNGNNGNNGNGGDNKITQYTVTYNPNGATNGTSPSSQTVNSGSIIQLPSEDSLSKNGYFFRGWSTSTSITGPTYVGTPGMNYVVTSDITLYAGWINVSGTYQKSIGGGIIYHITFNSDGTYIYTQSASGTVVTIIRGNYSVSGTGSNIWLFAYTSDDNSDDNIVTSFKVDSSDALLQYGNIHDYWLR